MTILALLALPALKAYFWIQNGETWKAVVLGLGVAALAALVGWAWWRIKKARSGGKYQDPLLIKEKVSRIAYEAQLEITAVLSEHGTEGRARELLRNVASAYSHYNNPAGASFRATRVRPALPIAEPLPPRRGLLQSRNVLGVRSLRPCGTRWGPGTSCPWWPARGPGCSSPPQGASPQEPTWGTPWEAGRGISTSRRTHCAATTSTWPAPAWASPP